MNTERDAKYVWAQLSNIELPERLRESILIRIDELERRKAWVRAGVLGSVTLLSCAGFIASFLYTLDEFYLSGFSEFLTLMFTDTRAALVDWHSLALALIESLPALPLALLCSALFLFMWSAARSLRNVNTALQYSQTLKRFHY